MRTSSINPFKKGWIIDINQPMQGNIYFRVAHENGGGVWLPNALVYENIWYHLAFVINRDSTRAATYLNGVLISNGWIGSLGHDLSTDGYSMGIGGKPNNQTSFFFDGLIDEVRIWNIARTQSQIQSTLDDTLSKDYYSSSDSGLVGYWRFDGNPNDLSIYGSHGILYGDSHFESITVSIKTDKIKILNPTLFQNYPNPFNPKTTIEFSILYTEFVTLKIYNILGKEVATLISENLTSGSYKYQWDAGELASGIYFYRLEAGYYIKSRKMVVLK